SSSDAAIVFEELTNREIRLVAVAGCDTDTAMAMAHASAQGQAGGRSAFFVESLGRHADAARFALVASSRPLGHLVVRRLRMIVAVAKQGFDLCAARDRSEQRVGPQIDRSLEPLLPGF